MMQPSFGVELRPMAMGELIDRSAAFWRSNVRLLFTLFFPFQVIEYALLKAFSWGVVNAFPAMRGGNTLNQLFKDDPIDAARQMLAGGAIMLTLFLAMFLVGFLASIAACRFVLQALLESPIRLADAIRRLRGRTGTVLVAFVLSVCWAGLMCGLGVLPGLAVAFGAGFLAHGSPATLIGALLVGTTLAVLGWLMAVLWCVLRFFLVGQVIAMEDLGPLQALRRSGQLISGRIAPGVMGWVKMRATVLITVMAVVLLGVSFVSGLPALILQFIYGNPLQGGDVYAVPQYLLIPAELLQVVSQALFGPLNAVFAAMFYLDIRMRREGVDLELRLAKLEGARTTA